MLIEKDFSIKQGANLIQSFIWRNDNSNTFINLIDYDFKGQIRKSYYSSNISANLILTKIDSANGKLQIELNSEQTSNLYPMKYVYDVFGTNSLDNITYTILTGIIEIVPGVTR